MIDDLHSIYSDLRSKIVTDVQAAHVAIEDIMTVKPLKPRNRRGWFNLLGNIAKKVMGVATESDLKVLQKHISNLMVLIKKDKYERVQDVTKLHSYEVKADLRMNRLQSHLAKLDQTLTQMTDEISTLQTYAHLAESLAQQVRWNSDFINKTSKIINWLHNYNVNVHTLSQIKMAAVAQLGDIDQLIRGRLSVNLIEPHYLRSILASVNQALKQQSSNLFVKPDITTYYKFDNMVISSHDEHFLYIKIKIPVSSPTTEFSLYKIDTVPVPTSVNNTIYTLMQGYQQWLAISRDGQAYLELTEPQAFQIKAVLNQRNFLATMAHNESCVLNLFFGNTRGILSTCRHTLIKNPVHTLEFVYTLPHQGYLIYTPARSWTLSCSNSSKLPRPASNTTDIIHKGLFTIHIQCGCKLTSQSTELLPESTSCPANRSLTLYSANYLVYYKLYRHTIPLQLTIDDPTTDLVNFQLPPLIHQRLNFTDLEMKDGMMDSDKTDLDNFNAMTSTNNLDWTFQDWQIGPQGDTLLATSGGVLFALQIISTIIIIYLYRRQVAMDVLLTSVAAIHYSNAVDYYLPTTTPKDDTTCPTSTDIPVWRTAIIISSFIMSLINLLILLLEKTIPLFRNMEHNMQLKAFHTELYCCLYSSEHVMDLKLCVIPHDINVLTCRRFNDITDVTFHRRLCCTYAHINWLNLELYAGDLRVMLPSDVKVPCWHYNSLTRLQQTRTAIKFVLVQGDATFVISDWCLARNIQARGPFNGRATSISAANATTPFLPVDQTIPGARPSSTPTSSSDSGNDERRDSNTRVIAPLNSSPRESPTSNTMGQTMSF